MLALCLPCHSPNAVPAAREAAHRPPLSLVVAVAAAAAALAHGWLIHLAPDDCSIAATVVFTVRPGPASAAATAIVPATVSATVPGHCYRSLLLHTLCLCQCASARVPLYVRTLAACRTQTQAPHYISHTAFALQLFVIGPPLPPCVLVASIQHPASSIHLAPKLLVAFAPRLRTSSSAAIAIVSRPPAHPTPLRKHLLLSPQPHLRPRRRSLP